MKRVVVKVGSAVLSKDDEIAFERMSNLVDFISTLKENHEVILVSSGAVSSGYSLVKLDKKIIKNKQALAAIGQPILMNEYQKMFNKYNKIVSQVLVTAVNLKKSDDIKRVKSTIDTLLQNNVIPIVNENDATATQELELGDNDQLSAYITKATNSDMLIILSDIDAYYDDNPRLNKNAKIYKVLEKIQPSELEKEVTPNGDFATGGIVTKLKAAEYLMRNKIDMFLASGFLLDDVENYMINKIHNGGTLFKAKK